MLEASEMEKVFFTNSGTEAIEGALKIARRYAYNKEAEGPGRSRRTGDYCHGSFLPWTEVWEPYR